MEMQVILMILFSILIPTVIAFSSGDVSLCDAYANWGCPKNNWINDKMDREDRLNCNDTTGALMNWVAEPVRSEEYSVRSGDDHPSADKSSYEPEKIMRIYVRVLEYGWQFRGLLLYAVNDLGTTVGSWDFPQTELSAYYWAPPSCNGNKVLHTTAARKPVLSVLHFRAPKKGTGKITFHCLIKKGPANTGYFYWPMKNDLTLNEAGSSPKTTWFKATPGQSCDDACNALKLPCDVKTMKSAGTKSGFSSGVSREFVCNNPPIGSCADNAPFMDESGTCYYHTESCEDWRINKGELTCDSTTTKESRLCVCGDGSKDPNNPNNPDNPNHPDWKPDISSGTKIKALNILALQLLAGLVTLFSGKKNNYFFFAFFILLLFVGSCDAHNWMHTPGRAYTRASTIKPCLSRRSSDTHAQIMINKDNPQMFSLQWATGHGGYSWFLVLKGEDSRWMGEKDLVKMMQTYIDDAPVKDGHKSVEMLQKYHGASPTVDPAHDSKLQSMIGTTFEKEVSKTSAVYKALNGNPGTRNRRNSDRGTPIQQTVLQYKVDNIANDARVSYKSDEFPWIEAVYKYHHSTHFPSDFDGIIMSIDGNNGPGHYIVHWRWNGYYDCMDIDVREPTPQMPMIPNIYGNWDGKSMIWNRVDHCQYIDPDWIETPCAKAPITADWCKKRVGTSTTTRYGINVVPINNPNSVYSGFKNLKANIPWEHQECVSKSWTLLEGKITENGYDVGGWKRRITTHSSKICQSAGNEEEMSLKQAITKCAIAIGCTGISFKKASGNMNSNDDDLIFRICDDTPVVDDNEWDTFLKNPNDPSKIMKASPIKVSFQPAMCEEPREEQRSGNRDCFDVAYEPEGYLIEQGELYGRKEGSHTYGWSCSEHPGPDPTVGCEKNCIGHTHRSRQNFRAMDGENPTPENTLLRWAHHSCHPYFSTNSDNEPPYKYKNKNRSRWEIEVSNGVYKVITTHAYYRTPTREVRVGGCMIENIRPSESKNEYSTAEVEALGGYVTLETEVEVLDGRLTFEGTSASTSRQFDCYGINTMELEMVYTKWEPSFLQGSKNAWWQMELTKKEAIGLIKIKLPDWGGCNSWWAFRGTKCLEERARGWFDTDKANTGMIIGVSNSSDRKGHECGRIDLADDDDVRMDCKGVIGQYVYIKYPGNDRSISLRSVEVHKAMPDSDPADDEYVCYGVRPKLELPPTKPEYIVVQDPEDPKFYSTCYVREKNITWIALDKPSEIKPWSFNGQCIDCKNYQKNSKLSSDRLHTIRWKMSEECVDCWAETVPTEEVNPQEWVHAYSSKYCESSKNDCPTDTCVKRLYIEGRTEDNIVMDGEECNLIASQDGECSNTVIWRPSSRICECYKKKSCCRDCTPIISSRGGYDIFELQGSPPNSACTGGNTTLSEDKTMCCSASCIVDGTNYCGTANSDCNRKVKSGMCCKGGLQKSCLDHGAPCMVQVL